MQVVQLYPMEEGMHQLQVLLVPTTHLAEVGILKPQLQVEQSPQPFDM